MTKARLDTIQLTINHQVIDLTVYLFEEGYFSPKMFCLISRLSRAFAHSKALKKPVTAPYQSKVEFLKGTKPLFSVENIFASCWRVYSLTLQSPSIKPAMIYKLRDFYDHNDQECWEFDWWTQFKAGETPKENGRQYNPMTKHIWDINAVWSLIQLHKQRSLIIMSDLSEPVFKRQNNDKKFSAFTKEIALALKAGYKISAIKRVPFYGTRPFYHVTLTPPESLPTSTLQDLNPTEEDCAFAVAKILQAKNNFLRAHQLEEKMYLTHACLFKSLPESVEQDIVETNKKLALENTTINQEQINRLKYKNLTLRLTFNNPYGLIGLTEKLFTLEELDKVKTQNFPLLLSEAGLESLRNKQITAQDAILLGNEALKDKMVRHTLSANLIA